MTKMSKITKNYGKPRVVFFGSGPVAAQSLRRLAKHCDIEAVVTKPSTLQEMASVIPKQCVYTVNSKSELDDLISSGPFSSEIGILIDFGIIVSGTVINYFEKGIINSHFSLLPDLRGADPISFAILLGREHTGVSLMLIVEAMDEGPVLAFGMQEIDPDETTPRLTDKLILLSDALLEKELPRYLSGDTKGVEQTELAKLVNNYPNKPTYSRKLTKEDGVLNFRKSAKELEREIRAFIEWPKSRMNISGKDVVITKAHAANNKSTKAKSGDIVIGTETKAIGVTTTDGILWLDKLKPAGKTEMTSEAFLAGYGHLLSK